MIQKSDKSGTTSAPLVIASCDNVTSVRSAGVEVTVRLQGAVLSDAATMSSIGSTSRVYIALENMRGTFDATVLRVQIRVRSPNGGGTAAEVYLGSIALFGLRKASVSHPGGTNAGLTSYLDFTSQANQLFGQALPPDAQFQVSIHPHHELPDGIEISIERIRIYIAPMDSSRQS